MQDPSRKVILWMIVAWIFLALLFAVAKYVRGEAALTLYLYLDANQDEQPQPGEPAVGGHPCEWTPADPAQAGAFMAQSDANGYMLVRLTPGTWHLTCAGVTWSITVKDVAGASVFNVPVSPSRVWLPVVAREAQP